ncbi:MAG TPA: PQQ-dependent sugar dehydrogenase [Acidimicrobiia bacterium]
MRRLLLPLAALLIAACATEEQEPAPIPSTTTTVAAPTTAVEPETTTTAGVTTTTVEPTTTTTLPELSALAYEEVARIDFPIHLIPWDTADLVATKDGQVWLLEEGQMSEAAVLDINEQVRNDGEQGLLAIAVHPEQTDRLFAHYSANDGDTVVSEFGWDGNAWGGERELLRLDQPARNHNGGMIQFGRDGRLYLGLGDGGGANDRFGNGQNTDTLLGGLVAIDVDAATAELFSYGLRNPWRFWIEDDLVYIADVGQNAFEEISVSSLSDGANYGWPITEGLHCFRPSSGCDTSGQTLPLIEVAHDDGGTCSITGGIVYRGDLIPEVRGHFFYSDFCGGYLRSFRHEGGEAMDQTDWTDQVGRAGNVASFGVDGDGEMYVLTSDRILKVVAERAE